MFAIARATCFPDLFSDSSNPYYLIGEYHEDDSMENMDDPEDFFDKVDDPREPGVTSTPLRVALGFPGPFWPNFTANAGRGGWGMRNEKFPFFCATHMRDP